MFSKNSNYSRFDYVARAVSFIVHYCSAEFAVRSVKKWRSLEYATVFRKIDFRKSAERAPLIDSAGVLIARHATSLNSDEYYCFSCYLFLPQLAARAGYSV